MDVRDISHQSLNATKETLGVDVVIYRNHTEREEPFIHAQSTKV